MVLIKALLLFSYCVSCKSVLLSLAPLSLGQYIKTAPINKRKRTRKKFTEKQSQTDQNKLQCDLCPKSFSLNFNLKRHKRIHTRKNPLQCDFCQIFFSRSHELKSHRRMHTGEESFPCDLCHLNFPHRRSLLRHKITHTGDQPFKCDRCEKRFSQSGNLIRHKRNHSEETPFEDDQASKNVTKSVYLKCHEQKDDTKKKNLLHCPLCDKSFAIGGRLYVHRRKHLHLREKKLSFSSEKEGCGEVFFDELELYLHASLQHIQKIQKIQNIQNINEERAIIIEYLKINFFKFLDKLMTSHSVSTDNESFQNFLEKNELIMCQLEKKSCQTMTKDQLLKDMETMEKMEKSKKLESLLLADIIFLCLDVIETLRSQTPFSEKTDLIDKYTPILTDLTHYKLSHDEFVTVLKMLFDVFYDGKTVHSQIISILNNPLTDRSA